MIKNRDEEEITIKQRETSWTTDTVSKMKSNYTKKY